MHHASTRHQPPQEWQGLPNELGVSFARTSSDASALQCQLDGYELILELVSGSGPPFHDPTDTLLRACFINPRRFSFGVSRRSGAGHQEQPADGHVPTDIDVERDFSFRTNDPERLRLLLQDRALRAVISATFSAVPDASLNVVDAYRAAESSDAAEVDVLVCRVPGAVTDLGALHCMFDLVRGALRALNADPASPLEVPPGELPTAFLRFVEGLTGSLGGVAARVGDAIEVHIPDPLGLVDHAKVAISLPIMPRLVCAVLEVEAPLVPGDGAFTVDRRDALCFWGTKTGDADIDDVLVVKGDAPLGADVVVALRGLASAQPRLQVGGQQLRLVRNSLAARKLPALLGPTLSLWQAVNRQRAGGAEA